MMDILSTNPFFGLFLTFFFFLLGTMFHRDGLETHYLIR